MGSFSQTCPLDLSHFIGCWPKILSGNGVNHKTRLLRNRKAWLLLVHFNPEFPLIPACDASSFGIGALLAHRIQDESEKPIGYTSCTLSKAERNYSQLDKEGLSC